MDNRIKAIRTNAKVTQAALAKAIGTSQQVIQRWETGKGTVPFKHAELIAKTLEVPLQVLFPKAEKALETFKKDVFINDAKEANALAAGGLEVDGYRPLFIELRGRAPLSFLVSGREYRRLGAVLSDHYSPKAIEERSGSDWLVFDADGNRIAVNLTQVAALQFQSSASQDTDEPLREITAFLAGRAEPLEMDGDTLGGGKSVGWFLFEADSNVLDRAFYCFADLEGDHVFLRVADIQLLSCPHIWAFAETEDEDGGRAEVEAGDDADLEYQLELEEVEGGNEA
jgi:transcriptional regulator with XRE-family HTH domain